MSKSPPIRYAIYLSQSSEELLDFSSCDAQFVAFPNFVKQSGEPNLHGIGQHVDDEDYSGTTQDWPTKRLGWNCRQSSSRPQTDSDCHPATEARHDKRSRPPINASQNATDYDGGYVQSGTRFLS